MRKTIFFFLCLGFLSAPTMACASKDVYEKPKATPGISYKGVTDDPNRDVYKNYPYGQVKPLPIEETKDKKIMAEGFATIYGGNVENARLSALRSAYAEAVGRGSGTDIGEMTLIKNQKYVTQIITARARGFVKEYQVFSEGISKIDPSRYEVKIWAVVVDEGRALREDEQKKALRTYLALLGNPKLLIILPEERISRPEAASYKDKDKEKTDVEYEKGDTRLRITQEKSKNSQQTGGNNPPQEKDLGDKMRSTEAALAQAFTQYGYQVMTSDDLLAEGLCSPEVLAQAKAGVTARAVEVARAAGADLAFFGVLRMTEEIVKPANVELAMVTGEASAKALLVSSGKSIDAFHRVERASHTQMLMAYATCLDRVANNIAAVLAWKIPQILTDEYRETRLIVSGISLAQSMDLQGALSKIEGVESVRILQAPTGTKQVGQFVLMTGFVFVEPVEIVNKCSAALKVPVKLMKANKFEVECALEDLRK